jgi:hypothetical protein
MQLRHLSVGVSCVTVLAFAALLSAASEAPGGPAMKVGPYTLSGPFVHDNLAVFLIHGPDKLKSKNYLTLQEAMEKKIVVVHETGNVNELAIENISPDQDVYIQSGDIVKGGRQDRTIAMDFICPPKSGQMPINAFCVENGRWHQRGMEPAAQFASSTDAIVGKDLKLAARKAASQQEVWQQVSENQKKLSANAGAPVADARSASSLQLTLENKAVQDKSGDYLKALEPIGNGQDDVIGYAFAINGKVNSADVYANHALFAKLWPKLIKSSAVEAFAELQQGKTFEAAKAEGVKACIDDASKGKASEKDVTPRVQCITRETEKNVAFECRDRAAGEETVHANYVVK